jgi:hypothetical protein
MPRRDLERAVGAFCGPSPLALCGLGCPFLPGLLGPGLGGCQGFGCGLGRVVCVCIMVPLSDASRPSGQATQSAAGQRMRKQVGLMIAILISMFMGHHQWR